MLNVLAALLMAVPSLAFAQELNKRVDAPPSAKAVQDRLVAKTRSTVAGQGKDLSRQDIVNTDCSDLSIGAPQPGQGKKSLQKDNATVVLGNVVNLCR